VARTEKDWGGAGCIRALAGLTVAAAAVTVGVAGGLYDLHVLHWYISAAALLPAWTSRPLVLLVPAQPAPVTPEEREHHVHLRIDGTEAGTWFNVDQLRDHVDGCRVLLGELTTRAALVAERLPVDPAAEEQRIDAEWTAAAEARPPSDWPTLGLADPATTVRHPAGAVYPPEPAPVGTAEDILRAAGFPDDDGPDREA
jgi:hypothetical protein